MENQNVANIEIEARVYPVKESHNNTLAMASLTIANCFAVRGVKVVQGKNGPFVSMPQARDNKGGFQDVCYPITREGREQVSRLVLEKFHELMEQMTPQNEQCQSDVPQPLNDQRQNDAPQPSVGRSPSRNEAR